MAPDIVKYDGPVFNESPNGYYIKEKMKELSVLKSELTAYLPEERHLANLLADYCIIPSTKIEDIALYLEEDVAIMHQGHLSSICFCFPSGFSPADKIGKSFAEIHGHIPESDRLLKASANISSAMAKKDAKYRRYVWALSSLSSLSQHPSYQRPDPKKIEDLWFRTETQTSVGLGDDTSLFFVKVEMIHLPQIWDDIDKRKLILDSVSSMSDQILEYKGITKIKTIVQE
jgi:hypothetical protein